MRFTAPEEAFLSHWRRRSDARASRNHYAASVRTVALGLNSEFALHSRKALTIEDIADILRG